jgi:four helix bundle protein
MSTGMVEYRAERAERAEMAEMENDPIGRFRFVANDTHDLLCSMLPHERFQAWKLCHELVVVVYQQTQAWPIQERYGLTAQIRRATVSAAANIAEGASKRGSKEFRRYLDIALGSLAETSYLLMLARDLRLISPERWETMEELRKRAGGLTWRLARALQASL